MNEEEKKKADWARIQALTPRTKEGHLVGMIFEDQPEELYFPYYELDENGCATVLDSLEDYADGNTPERLKYARGYQREFVPVDDPNYMRSICYENPELNLGLAERHVLWEWRGAKKREPMKVHITKGGNSADADETSGTRVITATSTRMIVRTAKGDIPLANFSIQVTEHRVVHRSAKSDDLEDEFDIVVNTEAKTTHIVVAAKNIDNIVAIIQGNLQIMQCKKLGVAFVFNKDRDALRLPLNRVVFSRDQKYRFMLYGTFMVVGIDGDLNYTGLTREQLRYFKTRFHVPARMAMVDGKPEVVFDLLAR